MGSRSDAVTERPWHEALGASGRGTGQQFILTQPLRDKRKLASRSPFGCKASTSPKSGAKLLRGEVRPRGSSVSRRVSPQRRPRAERMWRTRALQMGMAALCPSSCLGFRQRSVAHAMRSLWEDTRRLPTGSRSASRQCSAPAQSLAAASPGPPRLQLPGRASKMGVAGHMGNRSSVPFTFGQFILN